MSLSYWIDEHGQRQKYSRKIKEAQAQTPLLVKKVRLGRRTHVAFTLKPDLVTRTWSFVSKP